MDVGREFGGEVRVARKAVGDVGDVGFAGTDAFEEGQGFGEGEVREVRVLLNTVNRL